MRLVQLAKSNEARVNAVSSFTGCRLQLNCVCGIDQSSSLKDKTQM